MKGTIREGGEIVQVQGGHIIRSTGRKDRHSKVYTLKGPRDRRVRLSAHTAIQFYDVQDRLGYDRPSKAVDWLIQKAKNAIDNLNLGHHQINPTIDTDSSNPGSNEVPLEQVDMFMGSHGPSSEPHLVGSMRSFFPTRASELDLSLHPIQESLHGWNNSGFVANPVPQQELFPFSQLQSNLGWNQQNFGTPFELGFRVPVRIYGDQEETERHQGMRS